MNEGFLSNVCIVRFLPVPTATSSAYVITLNNAAPWVHAAVRKLESLGKRKRGWDSYGGLPLQPDARQRTIQAIRQLEQVDLPEPSVVLGSAGTVQLEWKRGGKELDLDLSDESGEENFEFAKCYPSGEIEDGIADKNSKAQLQSLAKWLLDK
jgi:hypothetical protein